MTTYHADDLDRGHDFSEPTLWTAFASYDLTVLLCDNRPVGLCVLLSRLMLAEDLDGDDGLACASRRTGSRI